MLRVIVVDDETLARHGMRDLLGRHASVKLVGEAGSITAAKSLIRREKPDAVFLDIEMRPGSGFAMLQALDDPPDIVFVTAHSQYALKSYEFAAADYLLKPVDPRRLAATVKPLEKSQRLRRMTRCSALHDGPPVLEIKVNGKIVMLRADTVVALCADGDFTRVLVEKRQPVLAGKLIGELAKQLPSPPFLRLGRSLVVNGTRLAEIEYLSRNATRIKLDGHPENFTLGRRAAATLKQSFAQRRFAS